MHKEKTLALHEKIDTAFFMFQTKNKMCKACIIQFFIPWSNKLLLLADR